MGGGNAVFIAEVIDSFCETSTAVSASFVIATPCREQCAKIELSNSVRISALKQVHFYIEWEVDSE